MGLSKSNPPNARVKLLVTPSSRRIPWSVLSWLALGGGAALLVAVMVSGARLIVDPYSPNWLKTAFPGLVNSFEAEPQTAADIQAELRSQNLTAGPAVAWPQADKPRAWFYPVLSQDQTSIKELWVYRVRGDQLQRVDQVAIRPLKESFITTPLVGTASQVASVDSDAALATLSLMPSQSADGPWLLLKGQRRYGNTTMGYGQILSYQPQSHRLHRLLNWSSPTGQPPQWQTRPAGHQLVIDQTVGLRPSFLLYQLVPKDPPQLQEISLYRSVYPSDPGTSLYEKALKLSQGGVWSHSRQMMQSAKQALEGEWSAAAEAQLNLIELHANHSHGKTQQNLSSQQQQILAYLMDGQWQKALTSVEENPAIYDPLLKRLEREFEPLWRAVTTHLQVHPQDEATQIWGALLVTARQSPEIGQEWLQEKTRSKAVLKRLQAVGKTPSTMAALGLELSGADGATTEEVALESTDLPNANRPGRYLSLVGQARAITTPGDGWLRSQTLPSPVPGQTWYHIDVQLLQDSSGWGRPPHNTAASFWAESLYLRRQMQLFSGQQPLGGVTVHGIKSTDSTISLLALGSTLGSTPGHNLGGNALVTVGTSLRWLSALPWQPAPRPPSATSVDDAGILPTASTSPPADAMVGILATLGQQLGLTPEQLAQVPLIYTSLDLSGDAAAEHLFSMEEPLPSDRALPPGKTVIFSSSGEILYSDVGQQQSLLALTDKGIEQPTMLLIEQSGRYGVMGL